jgi:hypothetical protein
LIFQSQWPGSGVKPSPSTNVFDQSTRALAPSLMSGDFFMEQFARGYGVHVNWLTDAASLRKAKLEIISDRFLASSKVIGIFELHANILFQQNNILGVYFPGSKEHFILSGNADFFEAGIQYSISLDPDSPESETPMAMEVDPLATSPSTKMNMTNAPTMNALLNLPVTVPLFPFPDGKNRIPQTPTQPPESPSFFSPSFTDHLSTSPSSRHDPRIHTINIPFHLNSPTRSQSYPTTPSPVRANQQTSTSYSSIGRSKTHRTLRRPSDSPPPNITPVTARDLDGLLPGGDYLIIDIRAFAAYAKSRLTNAINVCIPTMLLKRSSLTVDDILQSIVSKSDKGRFARWKEVDGIVIYDSDSIRVRDSYPLATLAGKFLEAGFNKTTYGVIGTFSWGRG